MDLLREGGLDRNVTDTKAYNSDWNTLDYSLHFIFHFQIKTF